MPPKDASEAASCAGPSRHILLTIQSFYKVPFPSDSPWPHRKRSQTDDFDEN